MTLSRLEFEDELVAIARWWMDHGLDPAGGAFGEVGDDNTVRPGAERSSILQTRVLWFLSELSGVHPTERARAAARAQYRYVVERLMDARDGGLIWSTTATGEWAADRKQIYVQAFAIYAFSAYARAFDDSEALRHAVELARILEDRAFDRDRGGYVEAFARDWSAIDDVRLSERDLNAPKTMNTHLHVLEACTALHRAARSGFSEGLLAKNIDLFVDRFVRPRSRHLTLFYTMDWRDQSRGESYGHDIEASWLLCEAAAVLGDEPRLARVNACAIALAEAVVEEGIDHHGALAYECHDGSRVDERHWWPQAEALVGFYNAYQLTDETRFRDAAAVVWSFIKTHVIDGVHGEWRWLSSADRACGPYKAGFWKGPYHNGRAMMEMMRRLGPAHRKATVHIDAWPLVDAPDLRDPAVEQRVAALLTAMTLEEKVGQLIQGDIASVRPADLLTYRLGSILNGANSAPGGDNHAHPSEYLALADAFYDASVDPTGGQAAIPVIWGTDAVHGHSNIVGATVFPHNIGLGAARDPALICEIGAVTAREIQVTGMDWTFAPTVAVARDDRWGRTYESYAEEPDLVARYAGMMVEGLQGARGTEAFLRGEHIIATAKHYLGDGGTSGGVDQGDNPASEAELRDVHAPGYSAAIRAGVQVVMASFNSWHGDKLHGHRGLLTDVLVERMGFDGFVVGDWNGHGQVPGCSNESCASSFNAGVDMAMAPDSWKALYHNSLEQVKRGEIAMARLDEAVARILRVKVRYGVFERGRPSSRPNAGDYALLGAPAHRTLARRAVRQSLVLLKNNNRVLPLNPCSRILVAGDGAHDIGRQSGGWTLTWQGEGNRNEDFPNGQSIFAGLREVVEAAGGEAVLAEDGRFETRPDAAVVVFGEEPYAEFQGDREHLDFDGSATLVLMRRLRRDGIPVVAVFLSGRPLYVTPEINAADAFVAAWLPGTEGGGIADVLLGGRDGEPRYDFSGKLSFSWPKRPDQTPLNHGDDNYDPLFPYGYGLTHGDAGDLPTLEEFEDVGRRDEPGHYLRAGRTRAPYRMVLVSGDAAIPVAGPRAATPDGRLRVESVDRQVQEDAREITWNGPARFTIQGTEQDLTREASARMVLNFTYAVTRAPAGRVRVGISCAAGRDGLKDMTAELNAAAGGGWRNAELPLAELGVDVADLCSVVAPFVLESDGALQIRLTGVSLAMKARARPAGS